MMSDFKVPNITVLAPTNGAFEILEIGAVAYLRSSNVHTYMCNIMCSDSVLYCSGYS